MNYSAPLKNTSLKHVYPLKPDFFFSLNAYYMTLRGCRIWGHRTVYMRANCKVFGKFNYTDSWHL